MGIDCSALVQLLFAEQGVLLPRDVRDQWVSTTMVATPHRALDLLFFGSTRRRPAHVGLSLGGGYFLHARGRVLVGSLDLANELCDKALAKQFLGARSVPGRPAQMSYNGSRPSLTAIPKRL